MVTGERRACPRCKGKAVMWKQWGSTAARKPIEEGLFCYAKCAAKRGEFKTRLGGDAAVEPAPAQEAAAQ